MRPLPEDFHHQLAALEYLHGHGILYRGGPDLTHYVCGHEDCDEFITHGEVIRCALDNPTRRSVRSAEKRAKFTEEQRQRRLELQAQQAASMEEAKIGMERWLRDAAGER